MSAIYGEHLSFPQSDGSRVTLAVFGDEFYARYETLDGYTVVQDPASGLYCYAVLAAGALVSSGAPLHKRSPPGIPRHLRESAAVRNRRRAARTALLRPPLRGHTLRTFGPAKGLLSGRRVSQGKVVGLTILVEFDDVQANINAADVESLLNETGYSKNGNACSVRDYFLAVSGGKLDYTNRVVGPVRLPHKQSYYLDNLLVREALELAVAQGIELSEFDSRGEGIIDAVSFMYAGRTLYQGDLWPHNGVETISLGGKRTHFYMLASMGRSPVDLTIGTFCHETGHMLCRFPDLYDYGERDGDSEESAGMGYYCLMSAGNHLHMGRMPAAVCGYLRYLVDWYQTELRLDSAGDYEAVHGAYDKLLRYSTRAPNEYFIVENRARMGLDKHLPSSGLAVYHCDEAGSNEWEDGSAGRHYQCALLQADGHLDLENNRNMGDETDLFPLRTGIAASHETTPATRSWDGTDSGLIISNISAPGEKIRFRVGAQTPAQVVELNVPVDALIPDADPAGVTSVAVVAQSGSVRSVSVTIDITHPYVGDLVVALVAPSGTEVVLHDRLGGPHNDLRATYDSSSALSSLLGQEMTGEWKLRVRDAASHDVGRLNRWSLVIAYEATQAIAEGTAASSLAIPDNNPTGVSSAISIDSQGNVHELDVRVDIKHTYIGDLVVELVAPSGKRAVLHDQKGAATRDLRMNYALSSCASLQALVGESVEGNWLLEVKDLQAVDTGVLERWGIRIGY